MSSERELISWKTDAWKDRSMVANYAQRMIDSSGAIMMKNRIEVAAFARYARGQRILDVGVGTGRASLPLARAGYEVTGVDSSEAMLQKTRELAGSIPITLLQGDVAKLSFPDDSFDTVMALNTIGHFPHWQPILKEWKRVCKPGGRIVFDMFSMDHDIAYARAIGKDERHGITEFAPKDASGFYLRLKVEELVAFADASGLRVAEIQPYSVLIGSAGFNRFFEGGPLAGKSWDRLLSWIGADEELFDFLCFLEEELFGRLTTRVACRYVVVFDNTPDMAANKQWRTRNADLNAKLEEGLSAQTLATAGVDAAAFRPRLNGFLNHAPNRYALYRILCANAKWNWPLALDDFLDAPWISEATAILQRAHLDAALTDFLMNFHRQEQFRDALTFKGVPLFAPWEYESMIALLDGPARAFDTPLEAPVGGARVRG